MREWKTSSLAELSIDVSYGYTESASLEKVGPRFLRITDIQNGVVNWSEVPYCPISWQNHEKYKLQNGDIVVARTGNSTGENYLFQGNEDAVFASYLIRFRINLEQADPKFVWYNLRSRTWWDFINNSKTGSAQAGANAKVLGTFSFYLPPLPEQRAITHILGSLDDKIELNRKRNETLEAMARALFQDWFVDFGPVRAKMEGREPYLPVDIWDLFPERLDEEGKPEGWGESTIGTEVRVCGGSTPSTSEPIFWEGGIHHWATPKDLSKLRFPVLLDTDRKITDEAVAKISSGLLPAGTVLLSSRAPIGYIAIAEVPIAINQGFIAMVCDGVLSNVFVMHWCRENMDAILANANGSTFQEISKSNFRPIEVLVPPKSILDYFELKSQPLYRHIVENERESNRLTIIRDLLLPKLISGEVRVGDAQKFLSEVNAG